MNGDLFSAGFAWGDDDGVASAATPVATPARVPRAAENRGSTGFPADPVASVASVANLEVSHDFGVVSATPAATPETADFCGSQTDFGGAVAAVASVATWMDRIERMSRTEDRPRMYHGDWRMVIRDAVAFVNQWGEDAIRAGWSTLDVFGTNPEPTARRIDRLGLVTMLDRRLVQSLDSETAVIGSGRSATVFRRGLRSAGAVPLWFLLGVRQ